MGIERVGDPPRTAAPRGARGLESVDDAKRTRAAALGHSSTGALPGHLPRVTALEVEALTKKRSRLVGVRKAEIVAEVRLGMPVSGLVHLPSGETLTVNDDKGVFLIRPDKEPKRLFEMDELEGIAIDDTGTRLFVLQESTGQVHALAIADDAGELSLKDTGASRQLPRLTRDANKGWEGIGYLPKALAGGDADCLVCVHEGSPRRIGIYALPDLDTGVTLKLPKAAKELLLDIADVEVDPTTGHIFVVSDQSRVLVELVVQRGSQAGMQGLLESVSLEVVASIDLDLKANQKPEALHFDARGRLWVGLDNEDDDQSKGKALVLELTR